VPRPIAYIGSRLPRGWSDLLLQLALFFSVYQGYQVVRGLSEAREGLAFANAERIVDLERSLGTFFEPGLQQALIGHTWLIDFANWMYVNSHFTVSVVFLAWLYLFRNDNFYFVRNMFMVAMGIALVGYALFPTAPPRMLPGDVPSMHIGFSSMIAGTAVMLVRNPLGRFLWALYPLLVFWVIVVTANHYWLDAAAGLLVAIVSALVASRVLAPVRPAQWAFRPAVPEEAAA
jgi:hypothetical protein